MNASNQVAKALSKLFDDLIALTPKAKHFQARDLIKNFEDTYPTAKAKADGRTTAWDEKRRAEAAARWADKRNGEVFYLYKLDIRKNEVVETVMKGVEPCCEKLKIREAYLRSRLSSGRGMCSFGTGTNKTVVSKVRFSSDPDERFRQEFMVRHGREPGHHEMPGSGTY